MEWGNRGDVTYVWKMRTQLVAAQTVAEPVAGLATADWDPSNGAIAEIAGPREERLVEAARLLARSNGDSQTIEETSDPTDPDAELYANGAALPGPDAILRRGLPSRSGSTSGGDQRMRPWRGLPSRRGRPPAVISGCAWRGLPSRRVDLRR